MGHKKKMKKERLILTLYFIPFLLFIIAFKYVPIGGWVISFFRYKPGLQLWQCEFVGLDNFTMIFKNWEKTLLVLRNTMVLSTLSLLCSPLPAIFAIFMSEIKSMRFKKAVQTITTIPHFISWIIVYSLAFSLFSTEGVMNTILMNLGVTTKPINLLTNVNATWWFQTLINQWKGFGWNAILYFAAISGIDSELYDAASVDGANRFQKMLHITVPGISSTFFTLLVLSISNFLSSGLDHYLAFYNSAVSSKILVLDLYTYRLGLVSGDYSYSTAFGILKTFVSLILLFSANYASKKVRGSNVF